MWELTSVLTRVMVMKIDEKRGIKCVIIFVFKCRCFSQAILGGGWEYVGTSKCCLKKQLLLSSCHFLLGSFPPEIDPLVVSLLLLLLLLCYFCSVTIVPIFLSCSPLPHVSLPAPRHSHSQSPLCCPCLWVLYAGYLTRPLPLPFWSLSLPCFHISGSILLICLFCSLGSSYR